MEKENVTAQWDEKVREYTTTAVHGISIRGMLHQRLEEPNQDAFRFKLGDKLSYLIVADGLGSCKHSHVGAQAAVDLFAQWIEEQSFFQSSLAQSFQASSYMELIQRWQERIGHFSTKDYDTTLHYAVLLPHALYIGGIGDGLAVYQLNKEVVVVTVRQDGFSNITKSLAMKQAVEHITTICIPIDSQVKDLSVILTTDGVADDLMPEMLKELPSYLHNEWQQQGAEQLQYMLTEWLQNWETSHHSDDRTFCLLQCKER